jgi:hypothetical protein
VNVSTIATTTAQVTAKIDIERTLAQNRLLRETPFANINLKLDMKKVSPMINIQINTIKSLLPAEALVLGNNQVTVTDIIIFKTIIEKHNKLWDFCIINWYFVDFKILFIIIPP